MTLALHHRMALALCDIARGIWHEDWDEADVTECLLEYELARTSTAGPDGATHEGLEIGPGEDFDELVPELLALEAEAEALLPAEV